MARQTEWRDQVLRGWKTIAAELGVSEDTAKFYHSRDAMPLVRMRPAGPGVRVMVRRGDLLDWLFRRRRPVSVV